MTLVLAFAVGAIAALGGAYLGVMVWMIRQGGLG